jgi:hypothetical protein
MESDFQTSFSPKRPTGAAAPGGMDTPLPRKQGSGLFMLIAVVVFIVSLLLAGGVFFYKSYLTSNIEQIKDSLERAQDIFEPETIAALQELDRRIDAAEGILSSHIAVSPIFELLREITYPNVQYTQFTYVTNDSNGAILVEMSGRASGFDWVGLQADQFDKNPHINNPIFSNLVQDQFGRITFDLTFSIDRPFVTYGSPVSGTLQNQALMN